MVRVEPKVVAERLREVVADEPKAFAYDLGISLSAVYNYMNGRIPSTEVLYRIAQYTGRPMEWFLSPSDDGTEFGAEAGAQPVGLRRVAA